MASDGNRGSASRFRAAIDAVDREDDFREGLLNRPPLSLLAVVAAFLAATALFSSCSAVSAAAKEGSLSWPVGSARDFVATENGLLPYGAPEPAAASDAPPVVLAALSAEEFGEPRMALVLGGWGVAYLEAVDGGKTLRLTQGRLEGLRGLAIGGVFPEGDAFLVQTFRDPFVEGASEAGGGGGVFLVGGKSSEAPPSFVDPALGPGFGLFALIPDPRERGAWLAQFRDSSSTPTRSEYRLFRGPPGARPLGLSQEAFEKRLAPLDVRKASPELLGDLRALGVGENGEVLVELASSEGSLAWYGTGADPSSGRILRAWRDAAGDILLLSESGEAAYCEVGAEACSFALKPPVEGALFRGLAFFPLPGDRGTLVALAGWESSDRRRSGALATTITLSR